MIYARDDDVNRALARAVKEAELSPEAVRRVVEGFNVLRTLVHLDSASGEKRAASFPIADAEEVLRLVYPSRVSSQRSLQQQLRLKQTLRSFRERRDFGVPQEKLEKIELPQKSPSPSLDEVLQQLEPEPAAEDAKRAAERTLRDQIGWKLAEALSKTAELVANHPADEVGRAALGYWGEGIRPLLRVLWRLAGRDPETLPKQAEFHLAAEETSPYREIGQLYGLLQKAAQLGDDEDEDEMDLFSASGRRRDRGGGKDRFPSSGRERDREGKDRSWAPGSVFLSLLSSKSRRQPDDMDIPMSVRAIRALEILDRISDEDPILRKVPRKDILRAFNQISQSYPQAASNYLTARTLLRKVLLSEGYLDPIDLAATGKMESRMVRIPPLERV